MIDKPTTFKANILVNYQFFAFKGPLASFSLFFIAKRIEIGIGSIIGLIISGPIMLLGLKLFGLIILLIEVDLIGYLILFVLFCLYLSPLALSFLRLPLSLIWSCDT